MFVFVEVMFFDICVIKLFLFVDFLNDFGELLFDVMIFVGFLLVRLIGFGVVILFFFWGDGEVFLFVMLFSEVDFFLCMFGRLLFLLFLVLMFLDFWFVIIELILMGFFLFLVWGLKVKLSVICVVVFFL